MNQEVSTCSSTAFLSIGAQKLGQPVPDSNFVSERKSSCAHPAQTYRPFAWLFQYSPVKAGSVPALRSTLYWIGVSSPFHSESERAFHSASVLAAVVLMFPFTSPPAAGRSAAMARQVPAAPIAPRPIR